MKNKSLKRFSLALCAVLCLICFSAQSVYAYDWSCFRGNAENNAIVNAPLPTAPENAALYWATKNGTGWSNAPSSPLIVNDNVVFLAGTTIYAVDAVTGETVADGKLSGSSSYNIVPPTYADGKIFVGLSAGRIEAIDAETLESLWVYKCGQISATTGDNVDGQPVSGGQPNCPIVYKNGYVYTGFWNGETKNACYVCVPVTSNIDSTTGFQKAKWEYSHTGGFYWTGGYATDDYLIVGSDDGHAEKDVSDTAVLYSFDPLTGEVIDKVEGLKGDIRTSTCYDNGWIYFGSRGEMFYGVKVNADGTFDDSTLFGIDMGGMVTSTPVVYNGRAYVGVCGESAFGENALHRISVVDLSTKQEVYSVRTGGYPQTSGLLTTAYEEKDGYVYVYFSENYTPGKLRVIRDKAGQTKAEYLNPAEKGTILFTPGGDQAQYCICSLICDEYGVMYFKNDSCYVMALGPTIDKIEVTSGPTKTDYTEGETFDPSGMKVILTYQNGKTRDVTKYVEIENADTPLTTDDFMVNVTFPYVMYQDTPLTTAEIAAIDNDNKLTEEKKKEAKDKNHVGQALEVPSTMVEINVYADVTPIIEQIDNLNGKITKESVAAARAAYNKLSAADKKRVTNYNALVAAEKKVKEQPFVDVKADWYKDAVNFSYWNGLITGTSKNTFAPDAVATRSQFVTILYRYAGEPAVSGTAPFVDLKADWYKKAVLWAYQNNIVSGTDAKHFSPDMPVTREQLMTIFYRYCKDYLKISVANSGNLNSFPDAKKVSSWAVEPLKWATAKGYISGSSIKGKTVLDPQGQASRGQIAVIMMRFVLSM